MRRHRELHGARLAPGPGPVLSCSTCARNRRCRIHSRLVGREVMESREFVLRPIGRVRGPYTETSQIPKGPGARHDAEGELVIESDLEAGLTDIEGFSHLYVLWIFDRSDGFDLAARPPTDDRPHGVFATRSPRRPNPLALTVVRLLGREGSRLHVRGIDMLDGTPIVDIKPYLSSVPAAEIRRGWLTEAEARKNRAGG
jgi:tRNA (adenine37-N6)-methyltransferase